MKKRTYTKKSEYWTKHKQIAQPIFVAPVQEILPVSTAMASMDEGRTKNRVNGAAIGPIGNRFSSIAELPPPFTQNGASVSISNSVQLCQAAYYNIAIYRQTIDMLTEFSNSGIYLKGENKQSKQFIKQWLNRINIKDLARQAFQDYYNCGNSFLYALYGKLTEEDVKRILQVYGTSSKETISAAKSISVPLKYTPLNPEFIVALNTTAFARGVWRKIFSMYELESLRVAANNPKTADQDDVATFNGLPKQTRDIIKNGAWSSTGVMMEIEPEKLQTLHYKKMDYEPFGVPLGWGVLDAIDAKLELQKIDRSIMRNVEQIILIITMGAKKEDGGVNQNAIHAMQALMENPSIGRTIVGDYTVKGEWLIPDLTKVLSSDRYKVINEDIRLGLQNILITSDETAPNQTLGLQIFLQRLKDAQNNFLNNFLIPEIKKVCKLMNFKTYPVPYFEEIDLQDKVAMNRVYTRLMELGILTPKEGLIAMRKNELPTAEESIENQKEYLALREKGMYFPMAQVSSKGGVVPDINDNGGNGRPAGSEGIPQDNARAMVDKMTKRMDKMKENFIYADKISASLTRLCKKKYKVEELNFAQKSVLETMTANILANESDYSDKMIKSYLDNPKELNASAAAIVDEICVKSGVNTLNGVITYKSLI